MSKSVLFVDSKVKDYQTLLVGLGSDVEVCLLNAEEDGVLQMAAFLKGRTGLDAIQIFSHGSSGALALGSGFLNTDNVSFYANALGQICSALSETGDILLYGCNVAQGEIGIQFINNLAQVTGADVAASDDLTGNAALGGDWVLEASTGNIEASSYNLQSYQGVLRDYSFDYVLAEMSKLAYQDNPPSVDGWTPFKPATNTSNEFFGVAFEKTNADGIKEIVIAYRGTDKILVTDISADLAIANPLNDWDVEFTDALNFAWDIKTANPDAKIYVTGHSLGGALAQVVSKMFGFDGATFDSGGAANIAASTDFADWKSAKTRCSSF